MELIDPELLRYSENHTSSESDLLKKINRDTHALVMKPRMLSGHLQGRLLAMISKILQPKCILEIGTYTGYSALCLAEGLAQEGKLVTLDINEELEARVRKYFQSSLYEKQIDYRIGDAVKIIPSLKESFDLCFIDADKENYSTYFDLVIDKMTKGGVILADNVLWSGKVVQSKADKDTMAVKAFNEKIYNDSRVECVMLPIRDGITLIRKK